MAKVINIDTYKEDLINSGYTEKSNLYYGNRKSNLEDTQNKMVLPDSERSLTLSNKAWKNTETYNKVWNDIEGLLKKYRSNVATFSQSDYEQLIDNIRIDITRKRFEYVDLTSFIDDVITNPAFSKSVTLDEFLPYGAAFKENGLNNDSVNMIEQKYGATGSVTNVGYAVGWKDTLENQLYNTNIFSLQKVTDAVSRGFVGKRNDLSVGEIIAKTTDTAWDSSQQEAAATGSFTKEELLYQTVNSAIEKITNLKDPQTGQLIKADRLNMICYPGDIRRLNRAINGQLNNSKGQTSNRTPLEINNLIPYYGDTLYVGKEEIIYTGVTKNKAYIYVPQSASYSLIKRGLTQETGRGSVLQLSTQELAWYFVQTSYRKEFFGSSDTEVEAKVGAGFGFIVEVTLPA